MERPNAVTLRGKPFTLVGPALAAGQKAPMFTALKADMSPITLANFPGRRVLLSVPSVDTPVCDEETRRFNKEAASLPGVQVLTLSVDLPFALKRFCSAAGIDKVTTLSDYREHDFGKAYGVLIKELKLLSRAVFVVDEHDKLTYVEYVPEVGQHPNYEAVLEHLRHPLKAAKA